MGIFSRRSSEECSYTREELRAGALRPAMFEPLEPRLLLDGNPTATDDYLTNGEIAEDAPATFIDVLANDTHEDPEETLTVLSADETSLNGGTITVLPDGSGVNYQPVANYCGFDRFQYTIEDSQHVQAQAYVYLYIDEVNDDPTAVDDVFAYNPARAQVMFEPLANDFDIDGDDTLEITVVTQGSYGMVAIQGGTTVLYTLNAGATFTEDSFTYTISDGHGGTATAAATVYWGPSASDNAYPINEDSGSHDLNVLANDIGASLTIIGVDGVEHGTMEIINDGALLRYTPDANFQGVETFTYTVRDADELEVYADVTVTVTNVNDNPVAEDDTATMDYGQESVEIDVMGNDSDIDPGDSFTIKADGFTQGEKGTVELVTDPETGYQTFTYTPGGTFDGVDTFTYTIVDSHGLEDTATVTVRMKPGAIDDPDSVMDEDTGPLEIDVLANDVIQDGNGETIITSFTQGAHGTVEILTDGEGYQTLTYLPDEDFAGVDTFTYTLTDANDLEATATVTVTVTNVNDNPVAEDDTATMDYGQESVEIDVLANDYDVDPNPNYDPEDPDSNPIDQPTIKADGFTQGTKGTVELVTDPETGYQTFTYTPGGTFDGVDTFTYTIVDSQLTEDTATVTVRMKPGAIDDPDSIMDEDTGPLEIDVLDNDVIQAGNGETTITSTTQGSDGTVEILTDGEGYQTLTYLPEADFHGEDTFTYTLTDANGLEATATVTVNVTNVNDAPEAEDDTSIMDYDQESVEIDVLANDYDIDPNPNYDPEDPDSNPIDQPTIKADGFTQGAEGTVELLTDPETGYQTFLYTPGGTFDGEDTFTYTIVDSQLAEDTATVTIRMKPSAIDDEAETVEDAVDPITIDVLANDIVLLQGGALSITRVTQGHGGEVAIDGTSVTYKPYENFQGTDSFYYTIEDEHGLTSYAFVTVTVDGSGIDNNDPLEVVQTFADLNLDMNHAPMTYDLGSYFWDNDSDLVYRFTSNLGTFDVLLYAQATPGTVANFQNYADSGAYVNSIIHRSMSGFVVQGGGYNYVGQEIPANDPIVNEFGVSNLRGTIAMAKLGGDPDSATSQWFFNLDDNNDPFNSNSLDNQNGGFTAFGEVLGDGMSIIDAIAAVPTYYLSSLFSDIPLIDYDGESNPVFDNLVTFESIENLGCTVPLTYTAISSNPGLVTATVDADGQLILQYAKNIGGEATITVRATDEFGAFVETTFNIVVNNRPDLVVGFGVVNIPSRPAVGDRCVVQLLVQNIESYLANGWMDLKLWASRDGDITKGNDDFPLATLANQRVYLGKNQVKGYTLIFAMPGNIDWGEYRLVAEVDSGNTIPERYDTNNTAVYGAQTYGIYSPHADLTGSILRTKLSSAIMPVGGRGITTVQVTNIGNARAAGLVTIALYASSDGNLDGVNDVLLATRTVSLSLLPLQSGNYAIVFTIPDAVPSGYHFLIAKIDSTNALAEGSADLLDPGGINAETNNEAVWAYPNFLIVQRPDLRTSIYKTNLSAAPLAGERAWAFIRIANYSDVRALGRVNVELYLRPKGATNDSQDVLLKACNNLPLNLRGRYSRLVRFAFQVPWDTEIGEYRLVTKITTVSQGLQEDNTANNQTVNGTVYQVRPAFVDLVPTITRRVIPRNPSTEGDIAFVQVRITNRGNSLVAVRGVRVNLWASTDREIDDADGNQYLLATRVVNLYLRPDGRAYLNFRIRIPGLDVLPNGDYYLVAQVDADDVVTESTGEGEGSYNAEDNNTTSVYRGLRIGLPDLTGTFRRITLPTTGVISGASAWAVLNVTNVGAVRVNKLCNITLYASQDGIHDVNDVKIGEVLNRRVNLWPGRTTVVVAPITLPLDLEGQYYILAVIDSTDAIKESNENNTVISPAVYNVQRAHVDLTGTLFTPIVANPALGGAAIKIPMLIRNNGNVVVRQRINIAFRVAGGVNALLGTLQNYLVSIAPGQTQTVVFNGVLPNVEEAQTYHVEADIDSTNAVPEWLPDADAEANNTAVSADTFVLNPAFAALNGTLLTPIVANPATAYDPMQATVQILNGGNIRFNGQVNVEFWAYADSLPVQQLGTRENVPLNLAPGQAGNVTHTMFLPEGLGAGTYDVVAVVAETPEAAAVTTDVNNAAGVGALTIGAANLQAGVLGEPLTGTLPKTSEQSAQVQVTNTGDVRSQGRADLQLWASSDGVIDGVGDYLLTTLANQLFNLAVGGSVVHVMNFTLPGGMDNGETYQLATVLIPTQGLGGDYAGDNTTVAPPLFNVEEPWEDLSAVILGTPITGSAAKNSSHSAQIQVTSNGNVPAQGQADVQLWATSDGVIDGNENDFLLTTLNNQLFDLPSGQNSVHTLNFTLPDTMDTGETYQLATVITDTQDLTGELSGNNTTVAAETFNVEDPQVDLTVSAVWNQGIYGGDGDPNTPDNIFLRGDTYSMTVSITNNGNIATGPFQTKLQALWVHDAANGWEEILPPLDLGHVNLAALGAGQTYTGTLWFTFPMTLPANQSYQVNILTDAGEWVAETSEDNNFAESANVWYFAV